jgi:hypothetical protein
MKIKCRCKRGEILRSRNFTSLTFRYPFLDNIYMLDRIRNSESLLRPPFEGEVIPNQHTCHEFGLPDTSLMSEDEALSYLADILLEWYFKHHDSN